MRGVTYHRVSTRDQRPDLAAAELRAAARQRGIRLVDEIAERGSGWRSDRPGLLRVLALAEAGAVDVVLVWKLDRFGRSLIDGLANIERLKAAGVRFVATTQGLDVDPRHPSAAGNLTLAVLAAAAEFERETIRERTQLAARHAKRTGAAWGRRRTVSPELAAVAAKMRPAHTWREIAAHLARAAGPDEAGRRRTFSAAAVRRAVMGHPPPRAKRPPPERAGHPS